jgi:hypothetical protein
MYICMSMYVHMCVNILFIYTCVCIYEIGSQQALNGRYEDFTMAPVLHMNSLSHHWYLLPDSTFITNDVPVLIHHYHPKSIVYIRVHSWCTSYCLGKIIMLCVRYYHAYEFYCLKMLCIYSVIVPIMMLQSVIHHIWQCPIKLHSLVSHGHLSSCRYSLWFSRDDDSPNEAFQSIFLLWSDI